MKIQSCFCRRIFYLLIAILTLAACHNSSKRKNEITKVTVASGGGEKPVYWAIEIDSSLHYQTYEKSSTHMVKEIGQLKPIMWDSINLKLSAIDYQQGSVNCDQSYGVQFQLIIHSLHGIRRINLCGNQMRKSAFADFINWFSTHSRPENPSRYADSLKFETTLQYSK
jgi:hypothetical protein